jgi:hypothetical protein
MLSHALLQQNGSWAQMSAWQFASEQPGPPPNAQQSLVLGGQSSEQSLEQLKHVSPALGLHTPSPQNSQVPQSEAQVVQFSPLGLQKPSPHTGPWPTHTSHTSRARFAQIPSQALWQQNVSIIHTTSVQTASLQPGALLGSQHGVAPVSQAPQSPVQFQHVSPYSGVQMPSPHSMQAPQSSAHVLHHSPAAPLQNPSPQTGGVAPQTSQSCRASSAHRLSQVKSQQKESCEQTVAAQAASLQPGALENTQHSPVPPVHSWQSSAQDQQFSPATGAQTPSPQNGQAPQSASQVPHHSVFWLHNPSPQTVGAAPQPSHTCSA